MKLARCLAALATGFVVLQGVSSHAAVFEVPPGNVGALQAAIMSANANGEDDVINLAPGALYLLQSVDNATNSAGANGLPVIAADGGRTLTINARGAIVVCAGSQPFRIFQINPSAIVTISALTMRDGRAVTAQLISGGGAILNDRGNLTLVDCTLFNNSASNTNSPQPASGGAIYNNAGTLALRGCTFENNTAGATPIAPPSTEYHGGAIYNLNGTVNAQICTFYRNIVSAISGGSGSTSRISGGAIANATSGSGAAAQLTVSNCTFNANFAPSGSPVTAVEGTTIGNTGSGATVAIGSSILAGAPPVLFGAAGSINSAGYNLTNGDGQGFLTAATDLINTDPQLRVAASNGGLTATCALPVTSPAVGRGKRDAIPSLAVTTDQRGSPRPYDLSGGRVNGAGDGSDIGAYEVTPTLLVTTLSDHAPDGSCNEADCTLREAIIAANAQANTDTIAFAPGITGTINLASGLPPIEKNLEICGPGADLLTLRRDTGGNYRLFLATHLNDSTGPEVALADLTLANGGGTSGGAIYNDFGKLALGRCVLHGNNANLGAAIYNWRGTVSATDTTFANNSAGSGDGGVFYNNAAQGPAAITLTNCTVSGNTAGRGASIYNPGTTGQARVTLRNTTFAGNTSANGNVYSVGSSANVTLRETLLSSPAGTANIVAASSAIVTSEGCNLSNDAAGGFLNKAGDRPNTDPKLDAVGLQDNGGPTPTIALLSDSPAINAGLPANPLGLDQRGYRRTDLADIGAFEFAGLEPPPPPTPTPTPTPSASPTPSTPTPTPASTPTPTATPTPNRFANISTRLRVETGENVLIGGFIVTGSMGKRIIVRAIGPSLDVPGKLENPTLELYDNSGTLLASNDNWQDAPNRQEIIDSTIPPTNDLEAAILQNVDLGPHTAIVSGADGGTGVGLVEVYDLGNAQDSKLANIATRGGVLTESDVMIGGLIVTGSSPQRVIIRAIGPSLPVAGVLADPFLELVDANANLIASNDNWKDTQQPDIEATAIPPSNDLEAAIVTFLEPQAYTAIVRGVNDTTGVAVVEIYALQ